MKFVSEMSLRGGAFSRVVVVGSTIWGSCPGLKMIDSLDRIERGIYNGVGQ